MRRIKWLRKSEKIPQCWSHFHTDLKERDLRGFKTRLPAGTSITLEERKKKEISVLWFFFFLICWNRKSTRRPSVRPAFHLLRPQFYFLGETALRLFPPNCSGDGALGRLRAALGNEVCGKLRFYWITSRKSDRRADSVSALCCLMRPSWFLQTDKSPCMAFWVCVCV